MDNNLIFDIADLYREDTGHTRDFHLELEQNFDPKDFNLKGDITVDVTFLKTDDAIAVLLEDLTFALERTCSRCLKTLTRKYVIPRAEREFFLHDAMASKEDERDIYTVDFKRMEIDLFEMFRQEILLHYEPFPVCSDSCRGICPTCGIDKNKAECSHEPIEQVETAVEKEESVKPLKGLTTILKSRKK